MSSGSGVHFGCPDIDACFRRRLLRGLMCKYFCWETTEAVVGKGFVKCKRAPPSQLVYLIQISLLMGFSWATCFAKSVSGKLRRKLLPPLLSQPLTDRSCQHVLPCLWQHSSASSVH